MDTEAPLRNPSVTGTAEKWGAEMAPLSIYLTRVPMVHVYSVIITRPVKLTAPKQSLFFLAVFKIYHLLLTMMYIYIYIYIYMFIYIYIHTHLLKVEEENPYIYPYIYIHTHIHKWSDKRKLLKWILLKMNLDSWWELPLRWHKGSQTMCYKHLLINIILPASICFLVCERLMWFSFPG